MIDTKKDKVVTFRISTEDYDYLKASAKMIGMTPSRYMRMLADTTISGLKMKVKNGQLTDADFKALLDD